MKVRVLDPQLRIRATSREGQTIILAAGQVYDLQEETARRLIEANLVTPVNESPMEVQDNES